MSENLAAWKHARPDAPPPGSGRPARAGRKRERRRSERAAYLFILPAFVVYAALVIAPLGHAAWLSLFEWDGVSPATLGRVLELPRDLLRSGDPLELPAPAHDGDLLQLRADRARAGGRGDARARLAQRVTTSTARSSSCPWSWPPSRSRSCGSAYELDGPLNPALRFVGLGSFARAWLGNFTYALPALSVIGTWSTVGFCLILFVAGHPEHLARRCTTPRRSTAQAQLREFFAVTLPGLRHELAFALAADDHRRAAYVRHQLPAHKGRAREQATTVPAYRGLPERLHLGEVGRAAAFGIALDPADRHRRVSILADGGGDEVAPAGR